ncbi:hypothetical protein K1719_009251 [Acacia pycnantha]|nr:hypothetical protein K1719_009251 [Acacia pycnantha]
MRNYTTTTNRRTGVGNTLKRHYETYLLEYELAMMMWMESAAYCAAVVQPGIGRQGLGAFKDYAKTDGLEYICPHCSVTNFKKKPLSVADNGFSQGSMASKPL